MSVEAAAALAQTGLLSEQLEALRVACGGSSAVMATTQRRETAVVRVP